MRARRLGAVLLVACAEPGAEGELAGVFEEEAWRPVSAEHDPLAARRPEVVDCFGWWPEPEVLTVDTNNCNWLTVAQPTRVPLPAGAVLRTRVEHGDLTSPDRADGYAALWLGGELIFESTSRIPGPAREVPVEVTLPRPVPAGTALVFHVDNHGGNVWVLLPVTVEAPATPAPSPS